MVCSLVACRHQQWQLGGMCAQDGGVHGRDSLGITPPAYTGNVVRMLRMEAYAAGIRRLVFLCVRVSFPLPEHHGMGVERPHCFCGRKIPSNAAHELAEPRACVSAFLFDGKTKGSLYNVVESCLTEGRAVSCHCMLKGTESSVMMSWMLRSLCVFQACGFWFLVDHCWVLSRLLF